MKKCFVFLAEGFEETEAVATIDVLRRGELHVEIVSITDKKEVTGAHGITIVADALFAETSYAGGSALVLPGGMPGTLNLKKHVGLSELLKEYHKKEKYLAAICAAPIVLGGLGLLEDKMAVCYPGFEDQLGGAVHANSKTVISDKIITSTGVISAVDFGMAIVRELQGADIAERTAAGLLIV